VFEEFSDIVVDTGSASGFSEVSDKGNGVAEFDKTKNLDYNRTIERQKDVQDTFG